MTESGLERKKMLKEFNCLKRRKVGDENEKGKLGYPLNHSHSNELFNQSSSALLLTLLVDLGTYFLSLPIG